MTNEIDPDTTTLDGLIAAFYETISFPEGGFPDWKREHKLFSPTARMTRMTATGMESFNVDEYRANFEEMLAQGLMPGFFEIEIARQTVQYADIAHLFSTYEGRRSEASPILFRGINSIQAYHRNERWWITSVIWFREDADHPIPPQFLP